MKRIIPLSEVKKAVDAAYEKYKDLNEGEVDSRLSSCVDAKKFGIVVALPDGTMVVKGDADAQVPLGGIVRLPVASMLLSQNCVDDLMKKCCGCSCGCDGKKSEKPHVGICPRGVRALSAVEPVGDSDSKWNFIENRMIDMMGSAPVLDDCLYKKLKAKAVDDNAVDVFVKSGYTLYDDVAMSIDLYLRAQAMKASARQLAVMGATIVSGGVNPVTKQVVFDGAVSPKLAAMMAAKGSRKIGKGWLVASGLPAVAGFGGSMVGVVPGVMSIAVCSPMVNCNGVSVKGAKAMVDIMNSLGISAFSNDCIYIDIEK